MDKQKVVLFDIDYTLFNTDLFREKVYPAIAKKINYGNVDEFYRLARDLEKILREKQGHFSPEAFIAELKSKIPGLVSTHELETIITDDSVYSESLFEASEDVLEALGKAGITIGILSTGNTEFQHRKIKHLIHNFSEDHIHIFVDKLLEIKNVLEKYRNYQVYIIDDLPTILTEAKRQNNSVTTIWVDRRKKFEGSDIIDEFKPDHTISDIAQVSGIVLSE
jgi:FMN phosphatase YigB (HAD superfamily)